MGTEGVGILTEGEEGGLLVVIARLGSRIKKTEVMFADIEDERDQLLAENGELKERLRIFEEKLFPLMDETGRTQLERIQERVKDWLDGPAIKGQVQTASFIKDIVEIARWQATP